MILFIKIITVLIWKQFNIIIFSNNEFGFGFHFYVVQWYTFEDFIIVLQVAIIYKFRTKVKEPNNFPIFHFLNDECERQMQTNVSFKLSR